MGFSSGAVVILTLTQKRNPRLLQIPDVHHFPAPSAIAISPDEELIVIGHYDGALGFYETASGKMIKFSREVHKYPILAVCFYNLDGKHIKESRLITSDAGYKTCKVIFKKGIFAYDIDSFQLFPESRSILQIEVAESLVSDPKKLPKDSESKENAELNEERIRGKIIALASEKDVIIIQIEPKAKRIISFPSPPEGGLPSISWNNEVVTKDTLIKGKIKSESKNKEVSNRKKIIKLEESGEINEMVENKENEEEEDGRESPLLPQKLIEKESKIIDEKNGLYLMVGWGLHVYFAKIWIGEKEIESTLMGVFRVKSRIIYSSFLTENLCLFVFEGKAQVVNIYDMPEFEEIDVDRLDNVEFFMKIKGREREEDSKKNGSAEKLEPKNEELIEDGQKNKREEIRQGKIHEEQGESIEKPRLTTDELFIPEGVQNCEDQDYKIAERELITKGVFLDFSFTLYYTLLLKDLKTNSSINCYNLSFARRSSEKAVYFMHEKMTISKLTVLPWESYISKVSSTLSWENTLHSLLEIYVG
jgi:hypothetical protein